MNAYELLYYQRAEYERIIVACDCLIACSSHAQRDEAVIARRRAARIAARFDAKIRRIEAHYAEC